MMFQKLIDNYAIESEKKEVEGLGFIDDNIIFQREKIVKRGEYRIFRRKVRGFEIHYGVSRKYPLFFQKGNIRGTFIHGVFEDELYQARNKRCFR